MSIVYIVIIIIVIVVAYWYLKEPFISLEDEAKILISEADLMGKLGVRHDQIARDISAYNNNFKRAIYTNFRNFSGSFNLLKSLWAYKDNVSDPQKFMDSIRAYNTSLELILSMKSDDASDLNRLKHLLNRAESNKLAILSAI